MDIFERKSRQLLGYLRAFAQLRRRRQPQYDPEDRVIWFGHLPDLGSEVRSPMLSGDKDEGITNWLEVRKPSLSPPPDPPRDVQEFFTISGLDKPQPEPRLEPRGMAREAWLPVQQAARVAAASFLPRHMVTHPG